jgi:predicted metal-dependent enzyme (double-stranded beta helix superfamily)
MCEGGKPMSEESVYSLEQFCDELDFLITKDMEQAAFLEQGKTLLKKLLPNKEFVCQILEQLITDDDFVKKGIGTIDRHDLGIYFSPKGNFSMRLFVWLPTVSYPIHDHGAWGIVGGFVNKTQEIRYQRLDDCSVDGYAQIEEVSRHIISPNDVTHVLPFSIHHVTSIDNETSLTLHVYGRAVRKGFIKYFNITENSVHRQLTPKLDKRWHAIHALGAMGGSISKTLIEKSFHDAHPLLRWASVEVMRKVDEDGYRDLLREAQRSIE